jgi:hypothetical protein
MTPVCFEWIWDMSHLVFMGGLGYALNIIGIGLTYCLIKTLYDTFKGEGNGHH